MKSEYYTEAELAAQREKKEKKRRDRKERKIRAKSVEPEEEGEWAGGTCSRSPGSQCSTALRLRTTSMCREACSFLHTAECAAFVRFAPACPRAYNSSLFSCPQAQQLL